ncbi:MAG: vancomycin high temperature exclusion protein [Flavobacteriales bacterium]
MKLLKAHRYKILLIATLICSGLVWFADWQIRRSSNGFLYDNYEIMPSFKTGLLLGTSSHLSNGQINAYWMNRINAADSLLRCGKIRHLVISGDNSVANYDEPTEMRQALIERGIDSSRISRDYAGFRTLDSVVRIKAVFQQDSILIISQKFHNERAIYIAKNNGIAAWGFNAEDVSAGYGFKTQCREYLARTKALLDIFFRVEPKFYGEKIDLPAT